jgi:RNA polymerase sigma factor (TIGR02999 family)
MDITRLLERWSNGDPEALAELMPLVYDELRRLAAAHMRRERQDHTLQPTALVHEAYLRLARHRSGFQSRLHSYGAAAQAVRRILVEPARGKGAIERGRRDPVADLGSLVGGERRFDLASLDDALERLASVAPRAARIVELRFFGGLSVDEAAAFTGVSPATVKREWGFARAWLSRARLLGMKDPRAPSPRAVVVYAPARPHLHSGASFRYPRWVSPIDPRPCWVFIPRGVGA